jgi:hypothetical protein
MRRMQRLRSVPREDVALVLLAAAATIWWDRQILFAAHVYQPDTLLLEYWTRRFQDPHLFTDPLTHALLQTAYVPWGVQGLYLLASYVVDPLRFGAWGAVVLAPFSAWLVFRIVRTHTSWAPGAWLAAALFLLPWTTERFSGTHSRAFEQPIILLTLLLVLRRRTRLAAVVPVVGALLYPPAALIGVGVVAGAAVGRAGRRPTLDSEVVFTALACGVAVLAVLLAPGIAGLPTSHLISASAARRYPEFGANGQMVFFRKSALEMLKGRYSGFDLRPPGAILIVAALAMVVLRPRNAALVRVEVWMTAAAGLVLFGLSYAVLFRLYLPNRYTHPLEPVACIVVGVCWKPTWDAIGARLRMWSLAVAAVFLPAALVWLGVTALVIGPQLPAAHFGRILRSIDVALAIAAVAGAALCAALVVRRGRHARAAVAVAAIFSAALLVGAVTGTAGGRDSVTCGSLHLQAYLRTLPPEAIIAGDPVKLDCVPVEARRPVVISRKLYQAVDADYFKVIRPRMFAMLRAYYGPSVAAIAALHARFGADYLVVQSDLLDRDHAIPAYDHMAPFDKLIDSILARSPTRAALELPRSCAVWHRLVLTVYDLRCVGRAVAAGQTAAAS